jgi:hypothetical protein
MNIYIPFGFLTFHREEQWDRLGEKPVIVLHFSTYAWQRKFFNIHLIQKRIFRI